MRRLFGNFMLLLFLFVLHSLGAPISRATIQDNHLPHDLVFTASSNSDNPTQTNSHSFLMRVDRQTLSTTTFFEDDQIENIRVLSVSPNSQFLAVFVQRMESETSPRLVNRLCILNHDGIQRYCFQEKLSHLATDLLNVTWSPDSTKIYFVSVDPLYEEDLSSDAYEEHRRLVEAEVDSGKITEILYRYKHTPEFQTFSLYLSNNLQFVGENFGITEDEIRIVDLKDQSILLVDAYLNYYYICPGFSPTGAYFVANIILEGEDNRKAMAIVDMTGKIHHTITTGLYGYTCPVWSIDEKTLYYVGVASGDTDPTSFITYSYNLHRQDLITYYVDNLYPIALSPNNNFIAFLAKSSKDTETIHILTPDKTILEIDILYSEVSHPIWLPEPDS